MSRRAGHMGGGSGGVEGMWFAATCEKMFRRIARLWTYIYIKKLFRAGRGDGGGGAKSFALSECAWLFLPPKPVSCESVGRSSFRSFYCFFQFFAKFFQGGPSPKQGGPRKGGLVH